MVVGIVHFTYSTSVCFGGVVIIEPIQYALRKGVSGPSPEGRQPSLQHDADGAHCDLLI